MSKDQPARTPYPADLTDAQWTILEPLMPTAYTQHGGRPRAVDMRAGVYTLWYLHRSGCPWEMLPHDLLPKSTAYDSLARWRDDGPWARMLQALRAQIRRQAGREPTPSAACLDSQSVKTTEMGGAARGDASGQQVKGRKRHLVVDTLGLVMALLIHGCGAG